MAKNDLQIKIKAVNKTQRAFRAVTVGLGAISRAAFSMKTALIGVGIAGFGFLVKKSLDATSALGEMADKIGIGTAELGGLRHAAELTGVATNTLDMGLQRMVRRISEAAAGTGEAKAALIELGLSAKALARLSPDQQFKAIADAMDGVAVQGEKVRLAMKLFDSEGVALVNTLKGGSSAIIEMEQEAERLGLRLNGGLVKGVERAGDAITKLSSFITGLFARSVAELAPAIESITNSLTSWFEMKVSSAGGAGELAKNMAASIVSAARSIISAFGAITNSIISFSNAIGGVSNIYERLFGDKQSVSALEGQIANTVELLESLKNASKGNAPLIASQAPAVAELELAVATMREMIDSGNTLAKNEVIPRVQVKDALDGLDAVLVKLNQVNTGSIDNLDVTAKKVKSVDLTAKPKDDYSGILRLQNGHYMALQDAKKTHEEKILGLTHLYLKKQNGISKASTDTIKTEWQEVGEAIKSSWDGVGMSIENSLADSILGLSSWKDATKSILQDVAREFVKTYILKGAVAGISGAIGGAFGLNSTPAAATGSLNLSNATYGLKTFDGGGFTGSGSRSGGVDGKGGFHAIVHPNETVVDHTKGQSLGGGQTVIVQQTINLTTGIQQTVRAEISNLMPDIANAAKSAVYEAQQRGAFG
jgi:hypothetical protein